MQEDSNISPVCRKMVGCCPLELDGGRSTRMVACEIRNRLLSFSKILLKDGSRIHIDWRRRRLLSNNIISGKYVEGKVDGRRTKTATFCTSSAWNLKTARDEAMTCVRTCFADHSHCCPFERAECDPQLNSKPNSCQKRLLAALSVENCICCRQ